MKQKGLVRTFIILLVVIINIAADQVTKVMVRQNVESHSYTQIIGPYFTMTKVENSGAFLSLGENLSPFLKNVILLGFPILALVGMLVYVIVKPEMGTAMSLAVASIVGGGIGNIYDRALYGSVTDFFHIKIGIFQTGVFNIADVSVMVGAGVILLVSLISKKQK